MSDKVIINSTTPLLDNAQNYKVTIRLAFMQGGATFITDTPPTIENITNHDSYILAHYNYTKSLTPEKANGIFSSIEICSEKEGKRYKYNFYTGEWEFEKNIPGLQLRKEELKYQQALELKLLKRFKADMKARVTGYAVLMIIISIIAAILIPLGIISLTSFIGCFAGLIITVAFALTISWKRFGDTAGFYYMTEEEKNNLKGFKKND